MKIYTTTRFEMLEVCQWCIERGLHFEARPIEEGWVIEFNGGH
jgi:hypothetical protein